jgi:hypothetical protein
MMLGIAKMALWKYVAAMMNERQHYLLSMSAVVPDGDTKAVVA